MTPRFRPNTDQALSMKLRVIIADDESLSRERLRFLLRDDPEVEIVAECANGKEAVETIKATSPDLLFLDVTMPELDGFGVIESLAGHRLPAIIFVTAYDRFALRAFEVYAVDYLLKPFERGRFQTALERARHRLQAGPDNRTHHLLSEVLATLETRQNGLQRFTIKSQGRLRILNTDEIDWICAADNYAELHAGKSSHLLRKSIASLAAELPQDQFARISRSILVNVRRIKEILPRPHGDCQIVLDGGTRLPGSRNYRSNLARLLVKPG